MFPIMFLRGVFLCVFRRRMVANMSTDRDQFTTTVLFVWPNLYRPRSRCWLIFGLISPRHVVQPWPVSPGFMLRQGRRPPILSGRNESPPVPRSSFDSAVAPARSERAHSALDLSKRRLYEPVLSSLGFGRIVLQKLQRLVRHSIVFIARNRERNPKTCHSG